MSASTLSDRQLAANHANAVKSTGPRTNAGKAKSSRNALRKGFYSECVAVTDEEEKSFAHLREGIIYAICPRDTLEFMQAERIASLNFRIRRLQQAQEALLIGEQFDLFRSVRNRTADLNLQREEDERYDDIAPNEPDEHGLTEADREQHRLTGEVYKSPDDIDPVHALMTLAGSDDSAALERLSRLEQRLDTQLQRAWKQLRMLQDPKREISPRVREENDECGVMGDEVREANDQGPNQNDQSITNDQSQITNDNPEMMVSTLITTSVRNEPIAGYDQARNGPVTPVTGTKRTERRRAPAPPCH